MTFSVMLPGAGGFQVVRRRLTHAQLLTLPASSVEIVPGIAGHVIVPINAWMECDTTAGIYTNIDAAAVLMLSTDDWFYNPLNYFDQVSGFADGRVTRMLAGGLLRGSILGQTGAGGAVAYASSYDAVGAGNAYTGLPLNVYANNGASGNFTGGNAANYMTVEVFYRYVKVGA